jgi:hypothetical protein
MANNYCTLEELTDLLSDGDLTNWSTKYNDQLQQAITDASRLIDSLLKRKPGAFKATTDETRYYTGSGDEEQWIDELASAPTSVSVAETGDITAYTVYSSTDYMLWPYNAASDGLPYLRMDMDRLYGSKSVWYRFPRSVKVVGPFGFSTDTPEEIGRAAKIQVVRWFKRGQQGYQDAGAITELGQLRYVKQLDPDVQAILTIAKFHKVTI